MHSAVHLSSMHIVEAFRRDLRAFVANMFETQFTCVLHAIFANEDGLQWPFDTYCLTLMRDVQKITDNDIKTFF